MRRWQMLHPRHHYTRSDGRVILTLAIVGLLALGVHLVSSHTGPAARGPHASSAPAPSTPQSDGPEVHSEREAIRQENRAERQDNWIWEPSEADVANHRDDGAMLFVGPIVGAETGASLEADVYINRRPVARADHVEVLMWRTRANPVFIDVVKSGYERWGFRYRFRFDGLRRVEGPVELTPAGSDDGGDGDLARR